VSQRRGAHFTMFQGAPLSSGNYSTQELKWHRLKSVVFNTTITVSQRRSICDPECPNSCKALFCHRQQSCKSAPSKFVASARSKGFAVNMKMSTAIKRRPHCIQCPRGIAQAPPASTWGGVIAAFDLYKREQQPLIPWSTALGPNVVRYTLVCTFCWLLLLGR
jgi:hypothetical protein